MIGFNRRFDSSFAEVRRRVDAGEIGSLEQLTIVSRDPAPPPAEYVASSGGLFRDMMIHDFDMARFLLGEEPVVVMAMDRIQSGADQEPYSAAIARAREWVVGMQSVDGGWAAFDADRSLAPAAWPSLQQFEWQSARLGNSRPVWVFATGNTTPLERPLAILLALLFPVYMWLTALTSKRWQKFEAIKNENIDVANGRFAEVVGQVKVTKSYGAEVREQAFLRRA